MNRDRLKKVKISFDAWWVNLKLSVGTDAKYLRNTFRDRWNGFAYWIRFNMAKLGKFLKRIGRKLRHPRTHAQYHARIMMMSVNGISTRFKRKRKSVVMTTNFDSTRFASEIPSESNELAPTQEAAATYEQKYEKEIHQQNILEKVSALIMGLFKRFQPVFILLPVILLMVFGYAVYLSANRIGVYEVLVSKENFQNKTLSIYVNEDQDSFKFGDEKVFGTVPTPEVLASPVSFIWKPKESPLKKTVTVMASIEDTQDWDISLVCSTCTLTQKYKWHPFYRSKLIGYELSHQGSDVNVYTKNKITAAQANPDTQTWLKENIASGATVQILDSSYPKAKLANTDVGYVEGSSTTISKSIRGNQSYYVYLKDQLNLGITKQDLNWDLNSKDTVQVTLSDLDGNVVFQNYVEDDEDIPDSIGKPVVKEFNWPLSKVGAVYQLDVTGNSDWLITKLNINTNKIVLGSKTLLIDSATLFTQTKKDKQLKLYAWHDTATQTVHVSGENVTTDLLIDSKKLGTDQFINLSVGKNQIQVQGDIYLSGIYFAFTPEAYFDPFIFDLSLDQKDSPDVILSNTKVTFANDNAVASIDIPPVEFGTLDNLTQIELNLRNIRLDSRYNKETILEQQGYKLLGQYQDYKLWSKNSKPLVTEGINDVTELIKANVPDSSSVYVESKTQIPNNAFSIVSAPDGFESRVGITDLNFALRGSHSFYVYIDNLLNMDISKQDLNSYEGSDSVDVQLADLDGHIVWLSQMDDDGNTTTNRVVGPVSSHFEISGINKGVYVLSLNEHVPFNGQVWSDFVIRNLKINTNKIMIKDRIFNVEPIILNTNNSTDTTTQFYYWHVGKDQTVQIAGTKISSLVLGADSIAKQVSAVISSGPEVISVPKGDLIITGGNFAINKANWFDQLRIKQTSDPNVLTDFKLIQSDYLTSAFIKEVRIETR